MARLGLEGSERGVGHTLLPLPIAYLVDELRKIFLNLSRLSFVGWDVVVEFGFLW